MTKLALKTSLIHTGHFHSEINNSPKTSILFAIRYFRENTVSKNWMCHRSTASWNYPRTWMFLPCVWRQRCFLVATYQPVPVSQYTTRCCHLHHLTTNKASWVQGGMLRHCLGSLVSECCFVAAIFVSYLYYFWKSYPDIITCGQGTWMLQF